MELCEYFMPYAIIDLDHGTPVYSLRDVNLYGLPELFGIEDYIVLDDPTESCPMVLDYKASFDEGGFSCPNDKLLDLLAQRLADG